MLLSLVTGTSIGGRGFWGLFFFFAYCNLDWLEKTGVG